MDRSAERNFRQLLFTSDAVRALGIDEDLVWRVWLANDTAAIRQLSAALLHSYPHTSKRKVFGLLAWKMVERCAATNQVPPREVAELLAIIHGTERAGGRKFRKMPAELKLAHYVAAQGQWPRTTDLARKFGLSAPRVSQLKTDPAFKRVIDFAKSEWFPVVEEWNAAAQRGDNRALASIARKFIKKGHA